MIKAIIFDCHGVLTIEGTFDFLIQQYSLKYGKSMEGLSQTVRQYWDLAKVDKIHSTQFWERVADFLNYNSQALRREWIEHFGFRPAILPLIKKLKWKYKTALLTNDVRDWLEELSAVYSLPSYFDVILPSYEAKVAKPDSAIFRRLLQDLHCNAEECIYIDDLEKNITAARALGFNVIHFSSMEDLNEKLQEQDIMIT
ncbi:MAG: HAD family phosphatase [Nanoarchaeota archaeon]|nr:HAD family phosphatase [Nanoarchaeota archaeon]